MTTTQFFKCLTLLLILGVFLAGCATTGGGIAASTTPIEGRKYTVLGRGLGRDNKILLFGVLPVSGSNHTSTAVNRAIISKGGDAMIEVTVENYSQFWLLFTRNITAVEGLVIRFDVD